MHKKIKVVGHTTVGRKKINSGICQDKIFTYRDNKKRIGFIALADGAGSCFFSHLGAECIVRNLQNIIETCFPKYRGNNEFAKTEIIEHLTGKLKSLSLEKDIDYKQLASTLIFVYFKCSKGSVEYLAGHIGDGVIIMTDKIKTNILSHPVRGEYANSTVFVTSKEADSHFQIYSGRVIGNAGFMLISDGTAESLYDRASRKPAPACKKIFQWLERYSQKKCQKYIEKCTENILKLRTSDDCGIAVAKVIL